jgi:hypothetical protein
LASSVTGSAGPDRVTDLRRRGTRGGVIPKHRAMLGLRWTPGRVLRAVGLSALFAIGVLVALPWLGRLYAMFYEEAVWWVGIPAGVGINEVHLGTLLTIPVPYLRLTSLWPGTLDWLVVGSLTGLALIASFALPAGQLPARYFLRFVALVQLVSLGWFAFNDPPFLYPLPGYTGGLLSAGMAVLVLVPIVLGFTFYIFDHSLPQQLALSVLVLVHLAVFLPLQVLVHAALVHYLSALVQPTLFFIFGMLAQVLVFVGFYGWAMSWQGTEIPASPGARGRP